MLERLKGGRTLLDRTVKLQITTAKFEELAKATAPAVPASFNKNNNNNNSDDNRL